MLEALFLGIIKGWIILKAIGGDWMRANPVATAVLAVLLVLGFGGVSLALRRGNKARASK